MNFEYEYKSLLAGASRFGAPDSPNWHVFLFAAKDTLLWQWPPHTHTMVRVKRAAAVAGEAKRVGGDPGFGSDDDGFEAYLDHDDEVSTKYPCRLKSEGNGFYTAIFLKTASDGTVTSVPDGDSTKGVHFDPNHGPGHGIWRRDSKTPTEEPSKRKKRGQPEDQTRFFKELQYRLEVQ